MKKLELALWIALLSILGLALFVVIKDHTNQDLRLYKAETSASLMSDYIRSQKDGNNETFDEFIEDMPMDSLGLSKEEVLDYSFCY